MKSITAQQCVDTFIATWVGRYGVLATITSDQGRQFTSVLWTGQHRLLGVQLLTTKAYHPQGNGMCREKQWPTEGCSAGKTGWH